MAHVIIFPDQASFEKGLHLLQRDGIPAEPLNPPRFCEGLVASSIVVTGAARPFAEELESRGVNVSGENSFSQFNREVPEAGPPDPRWQDMVGRLHLKSFRPSLTDSSKLRVEISLGRSIAHLVPIMARLIRGGTFVPAMPALTFEEEHRLITIAPKEITVSRADDLLDIWVMVRTCMELVRSAWEHRDRIPPETQPRQGIGAIELFKRLPGNNCRECGNEGCMDFATGLMTGRTLISHCRSLDEQSNRENRRSLHWLLSMIGLSDSP